jgi:hypothetical protein
MWPEEVHPRSARYELHDTGDVARLIQRANWRALWIKFAHLLRRIK